MAQPLDDSQLLRLAADPRTRLFPPLRGSTVFGPLVVLAGLIPGLALVLAGELGDIDSLWALRTLDVTVALELQSWLEPGRNGLGNAVAYQPPLTTWVAALTVPQWGSEHPVSWRMLSLAFSCGTIWAMYFLGRRLGGPSYGVVVAVVLCGHPIVLRLATGTGPAALGMLWIAVTVWGFLGHLEGPPQLVSLRMLAGSVAWGLALLTVGPVAVVLFVPMLAHTWLLHEDRHQFGRSAWARRWQLRLWHLWLGLRTLAGFMITALSFSAWWQLMMLTNHGGDFWYSWCLGQVRVNFPSAENCSFWRDWLRQNTFLFGCLVIGLASVFQELKKPTSELARRRSQFVLVWWLTAFVARAFFDAPALCRSALIDAWDGMLLLPSVLLAAWGVRAVVLRQVQLAGEAMLVVLTLGLGVWRMTDRPWMGLLAAMLGLLVVALLPSIVPRIRRGARPWAERDWSGGLQFAMIALACGHMSAGLVEWHEPTDETTEESRTLTEFRKRVIAVAPHSRITLVSPNGIIPESLLFVTRSHRSESTVVIPGTPDGIGQRESMDIPQVGDIVIEWTHHEAGIMNDLPADRQGIAVGDQLHFRGRRLMMYRVEARQL